MMWFEHKIDGELSQDIRHDMRVYRREKGKGGHKFSFKDLLAIYSTDGSPGGENAEHALVTHHQDSWWQHYWRHPERGWLLQKSYATRDEADAAVNEFVIPEDNFKTPPRKADGSFIEQDTPKTATYVSDSGSTLHVSAESSPWVAKQMQEVLGRLGYERTPA